jgi:hypothetical protein
MECAMKDGAKVRMNDIPLEDGSVWRHFCSRLNDAADILEADGSPQRAFDRAEGARYLSRLVRLGLEIYLENGDCDFPTFYRPSHETAKMGGDNPDNLYLSATISGDRSYRLTGNVGTVTYLSIGSKANRYAIDGTMPSTGELSGPEFRPDAKGNFTIIASTERPSDGTTWLPLAQDSSMLHLRQTFLDRKSEVPATIAIERISEGPAGPMPVDPEAVSTRLMSAADFVVNTSQLFAGWGRLFMSHPNQVRDWGQDMFIKAGGDPSIFYVHGYWTLRQDEALVLTVEEPACEHWNIQINNWWMESLDYRYHPVWVNKHSAKRNADGTLTFVLAHQDPGFGNWLPTIGHQEGFVLLRWVKAEKTPVPTSQVVKLKNITPQAS